MTARLEQVQPLLAELDRVRAAGTAANADLRPRAVLGVYVQAVRELRTVALEARARIERAAAVIAEARAFAHRRRRRADKIAERRRTGSIEGTR